MSSFRLSVLFMPRTSDTQNGNVSSVFHVKKKIKNILIIWGFGESKSNKSIISPTTPLQMIYLSMAVDQLLLGFSFSNNPLQNEHKEHGYMVSFSS